MDYKKNYYSDVIDSLKEKEIDIKHRKIKTNQGYIYFFYIGQLTDRASLSDFAIKPLINYLNKNKTVDATTASEEVLFASEVKILDEEDQIELNVIDGFTVILFTYDKKFIVANFKQVEKKSVNNPELTFTIRGPRDSFTENMDTNLSLLRYRLKDKNLTMDYFTLGRRTRTRTAVVYLGDVANETFIKKIENKLEQIDVDGIVDSGELQSILLNERRDIFPQMGLAERSDMAVGALLEGKVLILVEGSPIALISPKLFQEFLTSCEDFYDNKYLGVFNKIIRITAIIISLTISSLYVAVVAFSSDVMAPEYTLLIAKARANVPFNAFSEALLIEFAVELIRESLTRVPKQVGSAIGIVGAIVIGQAAVSAGIFSPLMLIIAALSLLSSFVPPDYSIINPFRILKFGLLVVTAIFGMYGLTLGIAIVLTMLVSESSLGVPYFAPYTPYNQKETFKSLIYNKSSGYKRPNFLRTKNNTRIASLPNTRKKGN